MSWNPLKITLCGSNWVCKCSILWLKILCETLFLILSPNSSLGSCWTLMKTAYCSYTKHNTLLFNLFCLRLNSAPSKMPTPCKMSEFLWKPQTSAWIYDNNHTGRWHCNHLSLLYVQKKCFYNQFLFQYSFRPRRNFKTYLQLAVNNKKTHVSIWYQEMINKISTIIA